MLSNHDVNILRAEVTGSALRHSAAQTCKQQIISVSHDFPVEIKVQFLCKS